jgi:hypothetical protein
MLVEASANAKPTEIIRNLGIVLSGRAAARADKKSPLAGITKQLERFRRK